jgi:hypothetical protein
MKVATPGPDSGEGGSESISAMTPEWSSETNHGPRPEALAIQIELGAVVEA